MVSPLPHDRLTDRAVRLRRWAAPRLVFWTGATVVLLAAAWAGVLARRTVQWIVTGNPDLLPDVDTWLGAAHGAQMEALVPIAAGYALLVALLPYGHTGMVIGCAVGAALLGFMLRALPPPPVPFAAPPGEAWEALRGDTVPVPPAAGLGVVLTVMAVHSIGIIPAAAGKRRASGFHPLGRSRRALAAVLALAALTAVLWTAAETRLAVTSEGATGAELCAACLPHLVTAALLACVPEPGGRRAVLTLAVPVTVACGLWPGPLPFTWPDALPVPAIEGTVWTGVLIYVPAAVVLLFTVRRLLRWGRPR
ncbi:hypothetical protein [Sphaerisporangium sp. TRM90804]|uniref:hypothetical protein n=1 Tax=Sphaerisporangium sp. TRM90804 TaxID=3031113 RepID=UPI00244CF7A4|nr:hypothetical protein [Sphaerisporangium sp. TRM90804]MDH2426357.1 hypothetical protein [Sphaerisporangium sp. TRM90804]